MSRFYYAHPLFIGAQLTLPDAIAHHLRVLRMTVGARIVLFNGTGGEYIAVLTSLTKQHASAEVKLFSPREAELPYAVTLAQALPEASKMDWIIEKAVELGATAIQPIAAQRCVVKLSAERAQKKHIHWQNIIIAATEQSGRNRLASLAEPTNFNDWLLRHDRPQGILLTPRAEQSLAEWAHRHPPQAISVVVGPEGGFTEQEEQLAAAQRVTLLSVGKRILRTETAGLAALATLNSAWGEM